MPVTLLANPSVQVSCLFYCQFVQPSDFSQIVPESLFAQMRRIGIVEHPHNSLYICPLENKYLMWTKCRLILGVFYVVHGQVQLVLEVPKVLILDIIVSETLLPRALILKVLVAWVLILKVLASIVSVLSSALECTYNFFET